MADEVIVSPGPMGSPTDKGGPPIDTGNATIAGGPGPTELVQTPPPTPAPPVPPIPETPPKAAIEQTPPPKTIADPVPPKPGEEVVAADWPDDWRQKLAGDDKKLLARLERWQSPKNLLDSFRALEQRVSAGELKRTLPAHYTEEELAEFRKSNGIPDKPDGYDTNLGNGFVWGETDKPVLSSFTAAAHQLNATPEQVRGILGWYAGEQQRLADEIAERDEMSRATGTDALRAEWGKEFKPNLTAMNNMFAGEPQELFDTIMSARSSDGTMLGNRPDILKFFSAKAIALNPFAKLVDGDIVTQQKTADQEMASIAALMGDKTSAYWRGPGANAMQERYRELLEMKERMAGRAA